MKGTPLFPGAAFFEMASAGARLILSPSTASHAPELGLKDLSIPTPLILPGLDASAAILVQLTVALSKGAFQIASIQQGASPNRRSPQSSPHVSGVITSVQRSPPSHPSPSTAAEAWNPLLGGLLRLAGAGPQILHTEDHPAMACIEGSDSPLEAACSPAALDSCLQLGAVLQTQSQPEGARNSELHVPAGLEGILTSGQLSSTAVAVARQRPLGAAPEGEGRTDYCLSSSAPGGSFCLQISRLHGRQMGRTAPSGPFGTVSASRVATGASQATPEMLYGVTWLAEAPLPSQKPKLTSAFDSTSDKNPASVGFRGKTRDCGVSLCLFGLAVGVASMGSDGARGVNGVMMETSGALPVSGAPGSFGSAPAGSLGPHSSLLWGMLRTLAMEDPKGVWAVADKDPTAPWGKPKGSVTGLLSKAEPAAGYPGDAFGDGVRSNLQFSARLSPIASHTAGAGPLAAISAPAAGIAAQSRGSIVITGGLGSLGGLSAAYLAESGLGPHFQLLGRSGRRSAGPRDSASASAPFDVLTLSPTTQISMSRCDVASAEEGMAVLYQPGERLMGLVHSGGVLADGLLANLTPGKVRQVFAPKLAAAHHWHTQTGAQPAAFQVNSSESLYCAFT